MYKWLELMPYKIHIASSLYTPLLKIGVGASSQASGFVFIQIPWLATGGGGVGVALIVTIVRFFI